MPAFKSPDSYRRFAQKVMGSQRYVRDAEDQDCFAALLEQAGSDDRRKIIKRGEFLWRARLGHDLEPHYAGDEYVGDFPAPLPSDRMKPLRDRASEGRVNPKGIPCLYLSSQKETALAEVRPGLGSLVTVVNFKILRDVAIVDCSADERPRRRLTTAPPFIIIAPDEWDKEVWCDIDQAFSEPVTRDDELASYAPTQIISEVFRLNGFDGLEYKSAFGHGYNVALFDLDVAKPFDHYLQQVKDVKFSFADAGRPFFKGTTD